TSEASTTSMRLDGIECFASSAFNRDSIPTRITCTSNSETAWTDPDTTLCGAKSPPIPSTEIRIGSGIATRLLSELRTHGLHRNRSEDRCDARLSIHGNWGTRRDERDPGHRAFCACALSFSNAFALDLA